MAWPLASRHESCVRAKVCRDKGKLLGCRDIASGVTIGKLYCGLKWCHDTILMSRHCLKKLVSRHGFGVATRPGQGRPFACRD